MRFAKTKSYVRCGASRAAGGVTPPSSGSSGVALVIILLLIVVASVAVVAYVSVMQLDRSASANYAQSIRAAEMAASALDSVVAELQAEIRAGSKTGSDYLVENIPVFVPRNRSTVAPARVGTADQLNAHPNLLRVSSGPTEFDGWLSGYAAANDYSPGFPTNLVASSVATDQRSANRRRIPIERWLTPQLAGSNTAQFPTPHWVYLARSGPVSRFTISPAASDAAQTNDQFILGRFAYAIYDLGGLLDINVAGFHSRVRDSLPAEVAAKGHLAMADLTRLPGLTSQSHVDALVDWRNQVTGADAANYVQHIRHWSRQNPPNSVFPGDQTFLTRQDLLAYQRDHSDRMGAEALRYLTTFSRGRNSPSWAPTYNAAERGGTSGSPFNYRDQAETRLIDWDGVGGANDPNPNRDTSNVRVVSSFTRLDGSTARPGEPLLQRKFPLSWLNWLSWNSATEEGTQALARINAKRIENGAAPLNNMAQLIERVFGLTLVSGNLNTPSTSPLVWSYNAVTPNGRILTLQEVAEAGREPNFFEMLKAGILHGSLGKTGGNPQDPNQDAAAATAAIDVNQDIQIIRIGANLLDQVDEDSVPTTIRFVNPDTAIPTVVECYGVESLPYISRFTWVPYRLQQTDERDSNFRLYLSFEVWNPHANAAGLPPNLATAPWNPQAGPRHFRVAAEGGISNVTLDGFSWFFTPTMRDQIATIYPEEWPVQSAPQRTFPNPKVFNPAQDNIPFTTADGRTFSDLTFLWQHTTGLNDISDARVVDDGRQKLNGLLILNENVNYRPFRANASETGRWPFPRCRISIDAANPVQIYLQWSADQTNWHTFQHVRNVRKTPPLSHQPSDSATETVKRGPFTRPWPGGPDFSPGNQIGNSLKFGAPRTFYLMSGDARNSRFGAWIGQGLFRPEELSWWGRTLEVTELHYATTAAIADRSNSISPGWTQPPPNTDGLNQLSPLWLAANNHAVGPYSPFAPSPTRYTDPDGVLRRGDAVFGAYSSAANPNGALQYPIDPTARNAAADHRPIILNRPFANVGEMGYAFRDQPFKSLDFMTSESADAGLLDLFSVDEREVTAGVVHLGARNAPVIAALISGASRTADAGNPVTAAEAATLAQRLVDSTKEIPPITAADLVHDHLQNAIPLPNSASSPVSSMLKRQREVVVRGLADVGQSRVWNLLVDVIAQSGRFPPEASAADRFVVQGESRIWYHVAIDRWTGEVIDVQEEIVYE